MKNFLFFFFIPIILFSAPVGNPTNPSILEEGFFIPDKKIINFRLGYQMYDSQDLVMKFEDSVESKDLYLRKIKAFSNSGLFILNIKERLDLYAEIGAYKIEPIFRYRSNLYKSKSENDILYRAGTKLIIIEIMDFALAADIKYSIFNGSSSYLTQNDRPIDDNLKFKLKEWQVAVGLSRKITILHPYIGIAYKDTRIKMKNFSFFQNIDLVYKKKAGLFLGCAASLGSYILLNGEIRLVNERATIISGELRF